MAAIVKASASEEEEEELLLLSALDAAARAAVVLARLAPRTLRRCELQQRRESKSHMGEGSTSQL